MKLQVFSIYDKKAQCYSQPFYLAQKGQAVRAFSDLVADANSQISKHPEDYDLYKIADYDDSTGEFQSVVPPEFLFKATDLLNLK